MTHLPGRSVYQLIAYFITLVVAMAANTTSASADVIIVQSNSPMVRAGTVMTGPTTLQIPSGRRVVVILPSGATRTLTGPYKGTVASVTRGIKSDKSVFDAAKRYLVPPPGISSQMTAGSSMLATAPVRDTNRGPQFSWRSIPVESSGDICVERGSPLQLARQWTDGETRLTLIEMRSQLRAPIVFPAGRRLIAWPADVDIDPRATYVLRSTSEQRSLRLRLIAPLPAPEDTLRVLHAQRCQSQFRAYLRDMQTNVAAR